MDVEPQADGVIQLRPWQHSDAQWYAATATGDPQIQGFTAEPAQLSSAQLRQSFDELARRRDAVGFVICDAVTGDRLGNLSLSYADSVGEVSYWLSAQARGRGVAARALRLLTGWAFDWAGLDELRLWTHADNLASRRVAERAGFQRDPARDRARTVKARQWPTVGYRLAAPEAHPPSHILFDFFGTLVGPPPPATGPGFTRTYQLLVDDGATATYQQFLDAWAAGCDRLDQRCDHDHREYSMTEAGTALLRELLPREPTPAEVAEFVDCYLNEWNTGVRYLAGVGELVTGLGKEYRLAVVSNTHQADLVPGHLAALGLSSAFDAVVTSVELGWRKPHPAIYARALHLLGIEARDAVFVGDSYRPDYLGPQRAGIRAFLIDPHRTAPVPEPRRLDTILDLPGRLPGPQVPPAGDFRP